MSHKNTSNNTFPNKHLRFFFFKEMAEEEEKIDYISIPHENKWFDLVGIKVGTAPLLK